MGTTKRPVYRLVVADSRSPRDGRFIESIGFYDPLPNPAVVNIDAERVQLWLSRGARPSDSARQLLVKEGILAARPFKVTVRGAEPEPAKAPANGAAATTAMASSAVAPEAATDESAKAVEPSETAVAGEAAETADSVEAGDSADAVEASETESPVDAPESADSVEAGDTSGGTRAAIPEERSGGVPEVAGPGSEHDPAEADETVTADAPE
jgi:small subunit ribosomal protein S16